VAQEDKKQISFLSVVIIVASILAAFGVSRARGENFRVDVTGRRGMSGVSGNEGASAYFPGFFSNGGHGSSGTSGSPGERGQDAGSIDIRMMTGPDARPGVVTIKGSLRTASGLRENIDELFDSARGGGLLLSAHGGDGGEGGDGGNGGNGANGRHGSDATRYSWGGNGGNGGDGGHGGAGGYGGGGGNGGAITVHSTANDSHWLMLLNSFSINGGRGGAGGRGGSGGSGGWGGSGGSSYSWTESETSTDSEGHTVTHYTTHTNPGGSSGWSGSNGSSGSDGSSGQSGQNGDFTISVTYEDGSVRTYRERYNIKIESYRLEEENDDGIFEPGERVGVHDLVIRNTGGMPTPPPPNSYVQVVLDGETMVEPEPVYLQLPKVLQPGETFTFKDEYLPFQISDVARALPKKGEPYRQQPAVFPRAILTTVDREFTDAKLPKSFQVEFPVEIRPIRALPALARGESTTIYFEVKNISRKAFGSASELQRGLSLLLSGQADPGEAFKIGFIDEDNQVKPLNDSSQPLLKAIERLEPGQSRIVRGTLTAPKNAEAQTAYHIGATLALGEVTNPSNLRDVHQRTHRLVIVDGYQKDPAAQVLLVTNGSSTKAELAEWQGLFNRLGIRVNTWNLSYHGFLSLGTTLGDANAKHELLKDFRGKTLVLLNYAFEADNNRAIYPQMHLANDAVLKAAGEYGMHFLVVGATAGSNGEDLVKQMVLPASQTRQIHHESTKAFLDHLDILLGKDTYGRGIDSKSSVTIADEIHRIRIELNYYWTKPSEDQLKSLAEQVQRKFLQPKYPSRRYLVTYEYVNKILQPGGRFSSDHVHLGDILIRQMPDAPDNIALSYHVDETNRVTALREAALVKSVIASLSFPAKLDLLDRMLVGADRGDANALWYARATVDTILAEVSIEQRSALMGWFRYEPAKRLNRLGQLANYPFTAQIAVNSPAAEVVSRLQGGVYLLADHSYVWFWSKLTVFPITNGRATREWNYHYVDTFAAHAVPGENDRKEITKMAWAYYETLKAIAYQNAKAKNNWRNDEVKLLLEAPLRHEGVSAAVTHWATFSDRLVGGEAYEGYKTAAQREQLERQALEREIQDRRRELMGSPRN